MAQANEKPARRKNRYYWIRLKENFFEDDRIRHHRKRSQWGQHPDFLSQADAQIDSGRGRAVQG